MGVAARSQVYLSIIDGEEAAKVIVEFGERPCEVERLVRRGGLRFEWLIVWTEIWVIRMRVVGVDDHFTFGEVRRDRLYGIRVAARPTFIPYGAVGTADQPAALLVLVGGAATGVVQSIPEGLVGGVVVERVLAVECLYGRRRRRAVEEPARLGDAEARVLLDEAAVMRWIDSQGGSDAD